MSSFAIEAFNLTAEWCEQTAGLLKTPAPKVCDTIVGYLTCMMHAGFCHIHWNSLFLLLKYPFFKKKSKIKQLIPRKQTQDSGEECSCLGSGSARGHKYIPVLSHWESSVTRIELHTIGFLCLPSLGPELVWSWKVQVGMRIRGSTHKKPVRPSSATLICLPHKL